MRSGYIMVPAAILALTMLESLTAELRGHMKPLGSHQDPMGGIPVTGKFPSPWVFYQEFIMAGKPLVMKKVLEKDDIPAYHLWTDKYLRQHFGETEVEVEKGKKEERAEGGLKNMTMSKFLHLYQTEDIYQVFDITPDMKKDLNLPLSLQCGGFQNFIQTVVLWFSSGGTKSHLHRDMLDNINCLLDGKKEIIFIDKKYKDLVMADGWMHEGGYSSVDVESVDMTKFPQLQHVPYNRLTISKGDCVFIPYKWFHFVDSKPGRNLAINFWFHHLPWFNSSDCNGVDPFQNSSVPLSSVKEPNSDSEIRMLFLQLFGDIMSFYKRSFGDYVQQKIPSVTQKDRENLNEIFLLLDTNNNNVLTWDELLTVEIMPVYEKFPELFERIVSYIVDDEDSSSVISDDPEPIVLEEDNSEGQRSPKDQSSVTKTPDDLEKEKLIKLADDGNLVMEEEPFKNPHEEL
ncbi:bifunctional peptidase and (3S)-lysyl hydroxylase JMJD7-like [Crassostrea virginica]